MKSIFFKSCTKFSAIKAEKNKFELLTDEGWDFVAKASKILIDFIYEKHIINGDDYDL